MPNIGIGERKADHIDIALNQNVQFIEKKTGFDDVSLKDVDLVYEALPEINLDDVNCETKLFGHEMAAPIFVSGMIGGIDKAEKINRDIAKAVEQLGLGMGIGSQRAMIERPETKRTYYVRDIAPRMLFAGNIGIVNAKDYDLKKIEWALKEIKADVLAIHVNAAQEAVQPEGDTDFEGCLKAIKEISSKLKKPVYVKEVGNGFSKEIVKALAKTKIKGIDVGGSGGTSWTKIEYLRQKELGEMTYAEFGVPTCAAILEARSVYKGELIATGGIRNGLHVLKCLVLGADIGGIAWPVLMAQNANGSEGVKSYLERVIRDLKRGMFLVGAKNLKELKKKKFLVMGKTKVWLEQRKIKF